VVADLTKELSYDLDGFVFGEGTDYIVEDFEIDPGDIRTNDTDTPRADGVRFGRDLFAGQLLTFEIVINEDPFPISQPGPLTQQAALTKAWRADEVRSQSGAVSMLRLRRGGRIRRVYGRPRRRKPAPEKNRYGWVSMTCDFQCIDDVFYGDSEHSNTVSIVPPQAGGLIFPFTFPWSSVGISYSPGVLTVGGDLPAWMCFMIRGPIVRPVVEVVGHWAIGLNLVLQENEWVGIDPRPWSRGVRTSSGANLGGALLPGSPRLSDVRLAPGTYEIVLRGTSAEGTASMTTAWRESYASP
jgi:hypothetical protein